MEHSSDIGALATALAALQAELPKVARNKTNPFYSSKYADLDAVWEVARPLLRANGLSVTQFPSDGSPETVGLTTILLHKSGQFISESVSCPLTKTGPQAAGSAITYLRRYALSAVLGLVSEDDDDGNNADDMNQDNQSQSRGGSSGEGVL